MNEICFTSTAITKSNLINYFKSIVPNFVAQYNSIDNYNWIEDISLCIENNTVNTIWCDGYYYFIIEGVKPNVL